MSIEQLFERIAVALETQAVNSDKMVAIGAQTLELLKNVHTETVVVGDVSMSTTTLTPAVQPGVVTPPVVTPPLDVGSTPSTQTPVTVPVPVPTPQPEPDAAAVFGAGSTAPVTPPVLNNSGGSSNVSPTTNEGVERDAEGVVWDERIHASSKTKIANGTWRKRKNVDPAVLAQVTAELASGAVKPEAPRAVPVKAGDDYVAVAMRIVESGLTQDEVKACLSAVGAPDMAFIRDRVPQLLPKFSEHLEAAIAAKGGAQ